MEDELKEPLVMQDDRSSSSSPSPSRNNSGARPMRVAEPPEEDQRKENSTSFSPPLVHPDVDMSASQSPYAFASTNFQSPFHATQPPNFLKSEKFHILVGMLYLLVASFALLQGFGKILHGTFDSLFLGLYTIAMGVGLILYDLKAAVWGVSIEATFPFLATSFGRAVTIFFVGLLSDNTFFPSAWNTLVLSFDVIVAIFYLLIHVATSSAPQQQHTGTEELPGFDDQTHSAPKAYSRI